MKLNTVLLAGLVWVGLLTIAADSAFAGGYFSAGNRGGLPGSSKEREELKKRSFRFFSAFGGL
jgi:hypothetical protein